MNATPDRKLFLLDGRTRPVFGSELDVRGRDGHFHKAVVTALSSDENTMRVGVAAGEDGELWDLSVGGDDWRWPADAVLAEVRAHLGAALTQSLDADDQVIMGHVRDAYVLAGGRLEWHASQRKYLKTGG
jgi:hypothetical protein